MPNCGDPLAQNTPRHTTGNPLRMVQLDFCEARKGVMFAIPMRRLTLWPPSREKIAARRVPASSRPAIRDVAKTYILQCCSTGPWRRVFVVKQCWRTCRCGGKIHESATP